MCDAGLNILGKESNMGRDMGSTQIVEENHGGEENDMTPIVGISPFVIVASYKSFYLKLVWLYS